VDEVVGDWVGVFLLRYVLLPLFYIPCLIKSPPTGLGELTFLQLSTTYSPPSVGGHSIGYGPSLPSSSKFRINNTETTRYFASGTGAAGLVGAFLWWEVRGLGVRTGVGLSAVRLPIAFTLLIIYRS
jgi:battenin